MSMSGIVAMFLGVLIICSRGPLIFIPASALRWFRVAIKTKNRTRGLGVIVILIALPMNWSGISEESELAVILSIFGVIFLFYRYSRTVALAPYLYGYCRNVHS